MATTRLSGDSYTAKFQERDILFPCWAAIYAGKSAISFTRGVVEKGFFSIFLLYPARCASYCHQIAEKATSILLRSHFVFSYFECVRQR